MSIGTPLQEERHVGQEIDQNLRFVRQSFARQCVLRGWQGEIAKNAARRHVLSCIRTVMAHNFSGPIEIDDGSDLPRKETSGMKSLWILTLLLMPVFAGGCKTCYAWQLGRDRAAEPAQGVCAPPCATPCESGCQQ